MAGHSLAMKPWTETGELQATFSVTGEGRDFEVTFESGDGNGRNTQYREGLAIVLERLAALDGVLVDARITADGIEKRLRGDAPNFSPRGYGLPLALSGVSDTLGLAKRPAARWAGAPRVAPRVA